MSGAEKWLTGLSCRDVVSWSAVISGYVLGQMFERALVYNDVGGRRAKFSNNVKNHSLLFSDEQAAKFWLCSCMGAETGVGWSHGDVLKERAR